MATNDSMIQVKDLKKHYKMGTIRALDGVTVNINKGDVMAVIGPVSYTHLARGSKSQK